MTILWSFKTIFQSMNHQSEQKNGRHLIKKDIGGLEQAVSCLYGSDRAFRSRPEELRLRLLQEMTISLSFKTIFSGMNHQLEQ
jgi:hypothetical protein